MTYIVINILVINDLYCCKDSIGHIVTLYFYSALHNTDETELLEERRETLHFGGNKRRLYVNEL